mgnify:CR=1 FL=1
MSSIRAPFLGPIVGHTTATSCRLWIRAGDPGDAGSALSEDRRTIGVATLLGPNRKPVMGDARYTVYFRLHREYDRTGVVLWGVEGKPGPKDSQQLVLTPDTAYTVRMGTLAVDDPLSNDETVSDKYLQDRLPPATAWTQDLFDLPAEHSEATFRTFPEISDTLSFMLGSCHYPGLFWKKKLSDRIFAPMIEQMRKGRFGQKPRFSLMVGDQIYADMLNRAIPIGLADTFEEFQQRYHEAYSSPNLRKLMNTLPTYMILDDHEIEDNWTQDRIRDREKRVLFNLAIGAYMSYQWSHGPRNYDGRLFYSFNSGGYPFFVLDQRTQRYRDDESGMLDNHLLGRPAQDPVNEPSQLDLLCRWLEGLKDDPRPKFIVSPTVFAPNPVITTRSDIQKESSDAWPAFPQTRRRLLSHILNHNIQNVVFLSGDIHCSNVSRITFDGGDAARRLKAFSIVSSAFYWPFWFADGEPSNYVHDSVKENDTFVIDDAAGLTMDYTTSHFTQKDNFCRIDLDWPSRRLEARFFGYDGEELTRPAVLELAG